MRYKLKTFWKWMQLIETLVKKLLEIFYFDAHSLENLGWQKAKKLACSHCLSVGTSNIYKSNNKQSVYYCNIYYTYSVFLLGSWLFASSHRSAFFSLVCIHNHILWYYICFLHPSQFIILYCLFHALIVIDNIRIKSHVCKHFFSFRVDKDIKL